MLKNAARNILEIIAFILTVVIIAGVAVTPIGAVPSTDGNKENEMKFNCRSVMSALLAIAMSFSVSTASTLGQALSIVRIGPP